MKTLNQMLRELSRAEVAEFAVATDCLPCVKIGQGYEPVDETPRSTDTILQMLVDVGGSSRIEDLEAKPAQWTTRVEGVGAVAVTAIMRAGRVQARFTVSGRRPTDAAAGERPGSRVSPGGPAGTPADGSGGAPGVSTLGGPSPERLGPAEPMLRGALVSPGTRGASTSPLEDILAAASDAGASDVHVVAGSPIRLRMRGELLAQGDAVDASTVEALLAPCIPERLRATLAENGSCDFGLQSAALGGRRFRVNVSRQRTGAKACFRCIAADVPTLASLGLPLEIGRAAHHHQGLVLVTGPTGHGKTSTLAAVVDVINATTTHHVITVEDPVEYVHSRKKAMISQREVGTHTRSFQSALKASLREDPDVIVVGELRDTDTVRIALAASETGHLVLGTMNTPSAAKTIDRLVDLFPPSDQQQVRMTLAGGLHLIVGQRLLPAADGARLVGAVELLPGSVALWNLIREGKTYQIPSLQQRGKGVGIVRLDDSLADLVRAGRVGRAAAVAVAENPEELESVLSGKRAPQAVAPATPLRQDGPSLLGKAGQLFGRKGP
jgi:twitching motility protein PilT